MNNNKGITLIALVITIIVLLIITGITVYNGTNAIKNLEENKLFTELKMVQHAVQEAYYNYTVTKNEELLVGTPIDANEIVEYIGVTLQTNDGYYELSPDELKRIGIANTEDTYIVNYKTGEAINKTQKEINSTPLYIKGTTGTTINFEGDH